MPFVSQAQRGFMYAKHPKLAAEFESKTPSGKLPYYVKKRDASKEAVKRATA